MFRLWPRLGRSRRRANKGRHERGLPMVVGVPVASGSWATAGVPDAVPAIRLGFDDGTECHVDPDSRTGRELLGVANALLDTTPRQRPRRKRQAATVHADA